VCDSARRRRGETTLIDGLEMADALPVGLRSKLERDGVIYECLWAPSRWQAEFGLHSALDLVARLETFKTCRFTLCEGILHLFFAAPAILPSSAGPVFANGVLAHLSRIVHPRYTALPVYTKPENRVYFGDGALLDDATINTLIEAHDKVIYRHRWQAGDVLIADNTRFLHGREMTAAACERVLISRFGVRHPVL
jgi:hypothetical protein